MPRASLLAFALALLGLALAPASAPAQATPPAPNSAAIPAVPAEPDPEQVKDATRLAVNAAMSELVANLPSPAANINAARRFAVLPVRGDGDGYVLLQIRNLFTQRGSAAGFELYSRDDAEWKSLLDEIAWGQNFGDTMDTATVQKFGKIRGVEGLLVGQVTGVRVDPETGAVRVRFNLQAFRVETGQILWSTEKSGVFTPPQKEKEPLTPLDYVKDHQSWFSSRAGIITGSVVLSLFLLLIVFGRLKAAARPR